MNKEATEGKSTDENTGTVHFQREQRVPAVVKDVTRDHGLFVTLDDTTSCHIPKEKLSMTWLDLSLKILSKAIVFWLYRKLKRRRIKASLRPVGRLGIEAVAAEIVEITIYQRR